MTNEQWCELARRVEWGTTDAVDKKVLLTMIHFQKEAAEPAPPLPPPPVTLGHVREEFNAMLREVGCPWQIAIVGNHLVAQLEPSVPPPPVSAESGPILMLRAELKQAWALYHAAKTEIDMRGATLDMACDRLGGLVDGAPPHRGNFLQRIDELVAQREPETPAPSAPTKERRF